MRFSSLRYIVVALLIAGCGRHRPPVPPGTVPEQIELSATDEQYGHEVLGMLTQQFPLDTDDTRINRVRDIADRLALASGNDKHPWHIHVLVGDSVKNAAATRGNYLFVWTGMFTAVQSDTELATVIAHEMGHVLAQHTAPNPQQEAAQILSGILGTAAGTVAASYGYGGPLAQLSQMIVENIIQAATVNPQSQADELEADLIGLFMMADAQYDPAEAVKFWKRMLSDPDFQSGTLAYFSSHPSTEERVNNLEQWLSQAVERHHSAIGTTPPSKLRVPNHSLPTSRETLPPTARLENNWIVVTPQTPIFEKPDSTSIVVGYIEPGTRVHGPLIGRRWLKYDSGYVRSSELSPE